MQIDKNHTDTARQIYVSKSKKKIESCFKQTILGRTHLSYDLSCGRVGGGKLLSWLRPHPLVVDKELNISMHLKTMNKAACSSK